MMDRKEAGLLQGAAVVGAFWLSDKGYPLMVVALAAWALIALAIAAGFNARRGDGAPGSDLKAALWLGGAYPAALIGLAVLGLLAARAYA